jgi:F-type H+-transporting ATPase subunit b
MKKRLTESLLFIAFVFIAAPASLSAEETGADQAAETEAADHPAPELNLFDFSNEHAHALVALFANFIILVIAVYFIMRKPLGKRFRDRKAELVKAIEEAREAKEKAEAAADAARRKLASIDDEIAALKEEILSAGRSESTAVVDAAEARAKRLLADTEALVESEVARVAQGIREALVDQIIEEAKALIRERISGEDHDRLTKEYLKEMAEARSLDKP